jgi:hypothetical protein
MDHFSRIHRRRHRAACIAAVAAALAACGEPASPETDVASEAKPLAGLFDGIEWSIDAPWRLEPPFNTVPITVTFHDAVEVETPHLGRFCGIKIAEIHERDYAHNVLRVVPAEAFHELEANGKWTPDSDAPAYHPLVRRWKGEPMGTVADVGRSADWNATFLYQPYYQPHAGDDLRLQVLAVVSLTDACPAWASSIDVGTVGDVADHGSRPMYQLSAVDLEIREELRVHYGNPLPRFDASWVYGDLHYHSEGTDNEGEAAINYRSVAQAIKAMGLDFVFATEHASDAQQLTGTAKVYVSNLPNFADLPYWEEDIEPALLDLLNPLPTLDVEERRDMNAQRFAILHQKLHAPDGVDQEVLSGGGTRASQIFLGGEVDVIPEISEAEKTSGVLSYGNGLSFPWKQSCYRSIAGIVNSCGDPNQLLVPTPEGGRYKLKDTQGPLMTSYYARQHMIHLPYDATRADAFVSSRTTLFGGASKRLSSVLDEDYDRGGAGAGQPALPSKGYLFLAHPVSAAMGNDVGSLGPDIVPYSDVQLRTAFDSPWVLGLQLWNEDGRAYSEKGTFPMGVFDELAAWATDFDAWWSWGQRGDDNQLSSLHHGAATWDRMLLWGLDPSKRPGWVPAGAPRKVFMAGGSDAHGDLNFRRLGYMLGWQASVDTAIGKPRNLVRVGYERPEQVRGVGSIPTGTVGQTQVVDALRSGQFAVTDGPALRIAIDTDGDGLIGNNDVPMGGFLPNAPSTLRIVAEWHSTDEFGPVKSVDLYVGSFAAGRGMVYAPLNHGTRGSHDVPGVISVSYTDTAGHSQTLLQDGYQLDPRGNLRIIVPAALGMGGHAVVSLARTDYPTYSVNCTTWTETIEGYYDDDNHFHPPHVIHHHSCALDHQYQAERVYVRAFARTSSTIPVKLPADSAIERYAYTNPVWAAW